MKQVAIVVVCYNRRELLLQNLAAIALLQHTDYDTIVIDNGSTDGTEAAVRSQYPAVSYIRSDENLGGAGGFAKGIDYALQQGYEYVWCLDDDGMPHADALTHLLQAAQEKGPCILGPRVVPLEQPEGWFWPIVGPYLPERRASYRYTALEKTALQQQQQPFKTTSVALVGLFMHQSVAKHIGLPDSQLFVSNDDVEYCLRAQQKGYAVWLVPQALVYHPAMHTATEKLFGRTLTYISMPAPKLYYYMRNITYVNRRYYKLGVYLKMLVATWLTAFYNIRQAPAKWQASRYALQGLWDGIWGNLGSYTTARAKN